MLIFPTQTVDDVKTHFLFWYLPVTFCSCSAKVKAFSLLHHQMSLLFVSYYVHMCVWHSVHVYVDSSMNIQSRGKCLLSCSITLHLFSQTLVPLCNWTYTVSWSSEEAISLPTSALDNTEFASTHDHTHAFYVSVEIWTQVLMPTKESTLPLWATFPALYHQLIFLSFLYIHILYLPSNIYIYISINIYMRYIYISNSILLY